MLVQTGLRRIIQISIESLTGPMRNRDMCLCLENVNKKDVDSPFYLMTEMTARLVKMKLNI